MRDALPGDKYLATPQRAKPLGGIFSEGSTQP